MSPTIKLVLWAVLGTVVGVAVASYTGKV